MVWSAFRLMEAKLSSREKTAPQATKALSQEDVEMLYRTRQPTLSAAAEADAKYERANTVTVNTKAEL